MSFAVIQTGGKQYKVSASEILKVERLKDSEGKTVEFNKVLFLNNNDSTEIGNPTIKGAKVEATILKNTKNRTILVFKKRRRKNSRKKYGHRQPISLIRITKIFSKDGKIIAEAGPQKILSKKIVKGDKEREKQINEAKKVKLEENLKVKKSLKKVEAKQKIPLIDKEKKDNKKKPLITKKK
jgi:large subunit ribosomal protein L21